MSIGIIFSSLPPIYPFSKDSDPKSFRRHLGRLLRQYHQPLCVRGLKMGMEKTERLLMADSLESLKKDKTSKPT